jgi:predicted RNA-binding Zn ribbon-like protein
MKSPDIFATHNFGKVSPWIDLVNSEEYDGFGNFSDRLDDPAWLESFLRRWRLHPAQARKAPLPALKSLRRFLRGVAEALSASGVPDAREIAQINTLMDVPVRQRLVGREKERRIEIAPLRSDWDWILSRIAASAAEAIVAGLQSRIRICANDECRWAFRDPTKAKTKRWCSDSTCGNRARVRRARAAVR